MQKLTNIGKIQEFQRKLYEKAKANPKFRFYSLYDKTYRMDILAAAYRRAKANGGTCGVDGERFEDVERRGISQYLSELQQELKQRQYVPQPVKRVYIPKANGKKRPLGIPTVRDRIVQTAFLLILEPIFEADFTASSHGFRPNKSAHGAIRDIYKYLNWGCEQIYDVDLEKYFDTVEHWKLVKLLALRISDGRILHVIKQWLSCGYVEDGQHRQSKRGTPQGGVISPLLANIYLNPIDQAFERNRLGTIKAGSVHLVRYADDMLLLAQNNLDQGIEILDHYFGRLGLSINREKTRQIDLRVEKKVAFLGFQFHRVTNKKTNKRLILVAPSSASQKKCREKVRGLVNHTIPLRVTEQIANVNTYLSGWVNYYRLGNSGKALKFLNNYVYKRVRRVIQRRRGKSGYGWRKISSADVYGRMGLYYNYKVQWL